VHLRDIDVGTIADLDRDEGWPVCSVTGEGVELPQRIKRLPRRFFVRVPESLGPVDGEENREIQAAAPRVELAWASCSESPVDDSRELPTSPQHVEVLESPWRNAGVYAGSSLAISATAWRHASGLVDQEKAPRAWMVHISNGGATICCWWISAAA
jgi:hypothetical protein